MIDRIYYTPEELAKKFRLSLSTIYNLIDKGDLPSVKIGKCYRIPESGLNKYLQMRTRRVGKSDGRLPAVVQKFAESIKKSSVRDKISEIIFYGSYARGDYNADSDIDILVILKKSDNKTSDLIAKLSDNAMADTDYCDFLSIIQITENQWGQAAQLRTPFYNAVTKEGIDLWKKL